MGRAPRPLYFSREGKGGVEVAPTCGAKPGESLWRDFYVVTWKFLGFSEDHVLPHLSIKLRRLKVWIGAIRDEMARQWRKQQQGIQLLLIQLDKWHLSQKDISKPTSYVCLTLVNDQQEERQKFINLLNSSLVKAGCKVVYANGAAELL